jgi:hypothetical protein
LAGKPERKRLLGRRGRSCGDNFRLDLREIGTEVADWIYMAKEGDQWRALVKTIMKYFFIFPWLHSPA